jgi:hypothetical protein
VLIDNTPTAIVHNGGIEVFARTYFGDGDMYMRRWNGSTWECWVKMAREAKDAP